MKISDEMVEAAELAVAGYDDALTRTNIERIVAAVAPLILEEAAKVAENYPPCHERYPVAIAAAIRALISELQTAPRQAACE
jgi:hypothetical protein